MDQDYFDFLAAMDPKGRTAQQIAAAQGKDYNSLPKSVSATGGSAAPAAPAAPSVEVIGGVQFIKDADGTIIDKREAPTPEESKAAAGSQGFSQENVGGVLITTDNATGKIVDTRAVPSAKEPDSLPVSAQGLFTAQELLDQGGVSPVPGSIVLNGYTYVQKLDGKFALDPDSKQTSKITPKKLSPSELAAMRQAGINPATYSNNFPDPGVKPGAPGSLSTGQAPLQGWETGMPLPGATSTENGAFGGSTLPIQGNLGPAGTPESNPMLGQDMATSDGDYVGTWAKAGGGSTLINPNSIDSANSSLSAMFLKPPSDPQDLVAAERYAYDLISKYGVPGARSVIRKEAEGGNVTAQGLLNYNKPSIDLSQLTPEDLSKLQAMLQNGGPIMQASGGTNYTGAGAPSLGNPDNGFATQNPIAMVDMYTGQTQAIAGEAGPERVDVTPMSESSPPPTNLPDEFGNYDQTYNGYNPALQPAHGSWEGSFPTKFGQSGGYVAGDGKVYSQLQNGQWYGPGGALPLGTQLPGGNAVRFDNPSNLISVPFGPPGTMMDVTMPGQFYKSIGGFYYAKVDPWTNKDRWVIKAFMDKYKEDDGGGYDGGSGGNNRDGWPFSGPTNPRDATTYMANGGTGMVGGGAPMPAPPNGMPMMPAAPMMPPRQYPDSFYNKGEATLKDSLSPQGRREAELSLKGIPTFLGSEIAKGEMNKAGRAPVSKLPIWMRT